MCVVLLGGCAPCGVTQTAQTVPQRPSSQTSCQLGRVPWCFWDPQTPHECQGTGWPAHLPLCGDGLLEVVDCMWMYLSVV